MTACKAIEYMKQTGKPIVVIKRFFDDPKFNGYYQLFQNETILKLMPDVSCAGTVKQHFTLEEFAILGNFHTFEPYEKPA